MLIALLGLLIAFGLLGYGGYLIWHAATEGRDVVLVQKRLAKVSALVSPTILAHDAPPEPTSAAKTFETLAVQFVARAHGTVYGLVGLKPGALKEVRVRLIKAGYSGREALSVYVVLKLIAPFGVMGFSGLVAFLLHWSALRTGLFVAVTAWVGLRFVDWGLSRKIKERVAAAQISLPDALDLFVVCAESGLGVDAALDRVAREIKGPHPILAHEMGLMVSDLSLLPDRNMAYTNMLMRLDFRQLRSVLTVLRQAEKSGTQVSVAMRETAAELRKDRQLMAEEKAGRLPALITMPVVIFMMPVMFLVILGPMMIKMMDVFADLAK